MKPRVQALRRNPGYYQWIVFTDDHHIIYSDWRVALDVANRESARIAPLGFTTSDAPQDHLSLSDPEVSSVLGGRIYSMADKCEGT